MDNLPEQLVEEFLSEYHSSGSYLRDRIARLAELAAADDTETAEVAARAVFTALVERLADSFEPQAVSLYNRAFAQVIQTARRNPRAVLLDLELERFALSNEEALIERAERLRRVSPLTESTDATRAVKRVIVLSRVTLGADVAITSVVIERMKRTFPDAEIVLVGGSKAAELFGGDPRVRFEDIRYRRSGTMIERLLVWIDLLGCVSGLTNGLARGEYLVVDPDSRLTQLGLLPLCRLDLPSSPSSPRQELPSQGDGYLFFPSREYGDDTTRSLSELTSAWLDELLGGEVVKTYPRVSLRSHDLETAGDLVKRVRRGSRPIIAINFGVGGNHLKRVGGEFEASLVARLIQEGAAVVLDKGAGDDEAKCADELIAEVVRVERGGRPAPVIEINEQTLAGALVSEGPGLDILAWNGRIGMLAGLIGECDLYIGYDSAGGHIAAALGIPCIDVFAGFNSRRFVERWRPTGARESCVVVAGGPGGGDSRDALSEVLRYASELLKQ